MNLVNEYIETKKQEKAIKSKLAKLKKQIEKEIQGSGTLDSDKGTVKREITKQLNKDLLAEKLQGLGLHEMCLKEEIDMDKVSALIESGILTKDVKEDCYAEGSYKITFEEKTSK